MNPHRLRAGIATLLILQGLPAFATSGTTLPRATAEALGMADANVALATGAAAQLVNPAGLAGDQVDSWSAGIYAGRIDVTYDRPAPTGVAAAGEVDAEPINPVFPSLAMAYRAGAFALGLSLEASHGTTIEWPDHTWEVPLGPARVDLARRAELSTLRFGPALAWELNPSASIGVRVFGQHISASEESDLYRVEGDGTSLGYQIGVRYRGETFIFASAYTSRTDTNIEGSVDNVHPLLAGTLVAGGASAHILLPDRLQNGVALRLSPQVWWELDADWIGWSYVDELAIRQSNGSIANAGKTARHNQDTWSYRTGIKWQARPQLTLHAGLGYDPSPVPDRDVSPTTSFLSKQRIGVGAVYSHSSTLDFGIAYQFVRSPRRTVGESDLDNLGAIDTGVFEGSYESRTHALGVNLAARF